MLSFIWSSETNRATGDLEEERSSNSFKPDNFLVGLGLGTTLRVFTDKTSGDCAPISSQESLKL